MNAGNGFSYTSLAKRKMNMVNRLHLFFKVDRVLLVALFFGWILGIYGINWGQWETWDVDQMAFHPLFIEGKAPYNPGWFDKPPFHTYFNYFLSVLPIENISKYFWIDSYSSTYVQIVWSRILTVFLFLGSTTLIFQITKRFFGLFPARIISLIFATSAGVIAFSHLLTADVPVMFWSLLSFYFCQNILLRGKIIDYILAGFFTGIATATKYNGLAIVIAIVVAHILSFIPISKNSIPWQKLIINKNLFLGLAAIAIGFIAGNPFSVLDYSTFRDDFLYNYFVTPVYDGATGNSYSKIFSILGEIIGMPSLAIFIFAFLFSLYLAFTGRKNSQTKGIVLLLAVALVYYYKFGSFPRLPTRFILPIVPILLIMSAPFWHKLKTYKIAISVVSIILISYNTACSFYVGKLFSEDPRMLAQAWVQKNIPENSIVESTAYSPTWNKIPGVKLKETKTPWISGRAKIFQQVFKERGEILELKDNTQRESDREIQWYSRESLIKRNPDYIAINSLYYGRFVEGYKSSLYPSMNQFFQDLLHQKYHYYIVFDKESEVAPSWFYPRNIDFLHNRMVILAREDIKPAKSI